MNMLNIKYFQYCILLILRFALVAAITLPQINECAMSVVVEHQNHATLGFVTSSRCGYVVQQTLQLERHFDLGLICLPKDHLI